MRRHTIHELRESREYRVHPSNTQLSTDKGNQRLGRRMGIVERVTKKKRNMAILNNTRRLGLRKRFRTI